MKDIRDFGGKGKVPARYRLGGKGHSLPKKDGKGGRDESFVERRNFERDGSRMCENELSPRTKYDWECLMNGSRDGGKYRSSRRSVNEEHAGNRCRKFRDCEDVFHEDMRLEMERAQELMHSGRNVGRTVSTRLVEKGLHIPPKNGYLDVYNTQRIEGERQQEEEFSERFCSVKDPCRMAPSPSQYSFSRPPSYSNLSEARENPHAEKVDLGGFSPEDAGPDFQSGYIPLAKASQYQLYSRTPSPLCISNSQDYKKRSLMTESMEGNSKSQTYIFGEDVVGISFGNGPKRMILSPYISQLDAMAPSSAGYGRKAGEYTLIGESSVIENTVNTEDFHRGQGARNHSDYVHSYMLPSPQSKYNAKTLSLRDCASLDEEQAYVGKQAIAERTERERYLNENNGPSYPTVGIHHMTPSPFKLEPKTAPSMPFSRASDPAAESVTRPLPQPQKCLRIGTPLPSYSSQLVTELSYESSIRLKELEDVRSQYKYNMCSNKLKRKISSASEDYGPEDRLWVPAVNGGDTCRLYHEPNLKSTLSLQHYQNSQEQGFLIHPHASVVPNHYDQDFDMLPHGMLPHTVKSQAHYHEDCNSGTYKILPDKFNHLDNDGKRQNNALNPGCFHSSSCCDRTLHGNTRAQLEDRCDQDNKSTFKKLYFKHPEHTWNQLGETDEREVRHLSSGDMQCQMLVRRSAHLQNKDFIGVGDEAFDNTTDLDCQLPFMKLPVRMRLGIPNNYAVRDRRKRSRPCTHSNAAQLSEKHKIPNPPTGLNEIQESHLGQSSDPSASNVTSEIAELNENSDKFKEQVNRAFLESVKNLFQSAAQQKKFMGLDTHERLKCHICGRSVLYFLLCCLIIQGYS